MGRSKSKIGDTEKGLPSVGFVTLFKLNFPEIHYIIGKKLIDIDIDIIIFETIQ